MMRIYTTTNKFWNNKEEEPKEILLKKLYDKCSVDPARLYGDKSIYVKYWIDENGEFRCEQIKEEDIFKGE